MAAILTLNTFAHTLGAAGVGAKTLEIYGESSVAIASGILTLLILIFSEIIPKTIGSVYWRGLIGNATLDYSGSYCIYLSTSVISRIHIQLW